MTSIALVAHDQKKADLIDWARRHEEELRPHKLFATGTTGGRLQEETSLQVSLLKSGPLGGDAQLGSMIADGNLDALVFFIDPLSAMPHDVDVKSLIRLAILYNTLMAVNEATATGIIRSLEDPA